MTRKIIVWVALVGFALGAAGGCREEGAGERAGKALDEAAGNVEDALEDAKEDLED